MKTNANLNRGNASLQKGKTVKKSNFCVSKVCTWMPFLKEQNVKHLEPCKYLPIYGVNDACAVLPLSPSQKPTEAKLLQFLPSGFFSPFPNPLDEDSVRYQITSLNLVSHRLFLSVATLKKDWISGLFENKMRPWKFIFLVIESYFLVYMKENRQKFQFLAVDFWFHFKFTSFPNSTNSKNVMLTKNVIDVKFRKRISIFKSWAK